MARAVRKANPRAALRARFSLQGLLQRGPLLSCCALIVCVKWRCRISWSGWYNEIVILQMHRCWQLRVRTFLWKIPIATKAKRSSHSIVISGLREVHKRGFTFERHGIWWCLWRSCWRWNAVHLMCTAWANLMPLLCRLVKAVLPYRTHWCIASTNELLLWSTFGFWKCLFVKARPLMSAGWISN